MSAEGGTKHIIQSLLVNTVIALAKFGAAFFTKSGAMLAEAIHSAADCGNQLLLLRGVKQGQLPPDEKHPLGYGRNVYFWSFMVALLLFSGGGVFSIYEGIHKLQHPEPIDHVEWALAILAGSLLLEGWATFGNIKELNKRRKGKPFFQFLQDTKDSDLVVVFGENSAAVLGLALALGSIAVAKITGDTRADAVGTLLVGLVLVAVAVFLAIEVKSLLVGESADPEIKVAAEQLALEDKKCIHHVISCITMQQGPGEVVVAIKLKMEPNLTTPDICGAINEFEARLRAKCPEARWIYCEPDLNEPGAAAGKVPAATPAATT